MAEVKFFKEQVLPERTVPNAWYLIENGDYYDTYVTTKQNVLLKIGNSDMINSLIDIKVAAIPTSGLGDMIKAVYDIDDDGIVNEADYASSNGGYF